MAKKKEFDVEIHVAQIHREVAHFCLLGLSPLIMERMSEKVKGGLLCPAPKKNKAEKESSLKHEPLSEYRESAYRSLDKKNPTLLQVRSTSIKRALATAALDLPGANKSQIGRLTYVPGEYVDIFGAPKLMMSVVRSSDMQKTPDIRTRCVIPQWCAVVSVSYITPQLKQQAIANLLGAAGEYIGIGGWRPEKGSGAFGRFECVEESNKEFRRIEKIGRSQQEKGIADPDFFDKESEDLYHWFEQESKRRGFKVAT